MQQCFPATCRLPHSQFTAKKSMEKKSSKGWLGFLPFVQCGMLIEQHKFLLIKSYSTQLFIYLFITHITLNFMLAEGLLIWTRRLLFCFVRRSDDWTDQSKITTRRHQICKQPSLLCHYEGAIERCTSSYSLCWQEGQGSFFFLRKPPDWIDLRKPDTKIPEIRL